MPSMGRDDDAIFNVTVDIKRERIQLKLLDRDDVPVIERRLIQPDGVTVTVAMPVLDVDQLQRFVDADPHRADLHKHFSLLLERYAAYASRMKAVGNSEKVDRAAGPDVHRQRVERVDELDLLTSLDALSEAQTEGQLYAMLRMFFERYGIPVDQFIFAGFRLAGESRVPAGYRYFGACDPVWLQLYVQRRWYMIDPFYSWSMVATNPIPGSQLLLRTSGQRDFYARLQACGFGSCIVAPARTAHGKIFGVFMAGSSLPVEQGEPALLRYRQVFRAIAAELLDWSAKNLALRAIGALKLTGQEITVLNLLARGLAAPAIARELGVSVNRIYKGIYPELTSKMQVDHISKALAMALELGMVFPL